MGLTEMSWVFISSAQVVTPHYCHDPCTGPTQTQGDGLQSFDNMQELTAHV